MKHLLLTICILLMTALLLPAYAQDVPAAQSGPAVKDVGLDLLGSSVHYPQLTGLDDEAVQSAVNAAIMEAGHINDRLTRMAMLSNAPVKLNVSYQYTLEGRVFSCVILADGAVTNSRATQVWSTVNIDLRTGEAITFADLFRDEDEALAFIAAYLDEQVVPELSAHLAAGSLTPVPEDFTISPTGLTLYYDIDDFRTLSDKAGTVTLLWTELRDHLRLDMTDVLSDLYVPLHLELEIASGDTLAEDLAGGAFDGVPAALGQSVQELVDRYALLTDPDIYEGGRMIALEDGAFRQVWLLTDALSEDFGRSVVQGIRADRLNFRGLCTGYTTVAMWRDALGEPDATLSVDESRADSWRIVPGTSDYYTFGDFRLRLHADESGVLRSVFLTR